MAHGVSPLIWSTVSTLWCQYRNLKKRSSVFILLFLPSSAQICRPFVTDEGFITNRSVSHPIWWGSIAKCSHVNFLFHPLLRRISRHLENIYYLSICLSLFSPQTVFRNIFIERLSMDFYFSGYFSSLGVMVYASCLRPWFWTCM